MIKIPHVFFWKFYSRGKLTSCFAVFTKECICNTQFYGLVTPTVHSSALSLKNRKLREHLFSGEKAVPLMEVLLILKIGRGKVSDFSEVTKFFPDFLFPDKVLKFCGIHTANFLNYVWPFFKIMHDRINLLNQD